MLKVKFDIQELLFTEKGFDYANWTYLFKGVYDMLDCGLWISHWVKDYKIVGLYGKYE